MQRDHIVDGFWQMPGKPVGDWPGTKNGRDHRVALSEPALALIEGHLAAKNSCNRAGLLLKKLVAELGIERVTPHDLRRTCLTTITRLGFGRDAMDRIANHRTSRSPTSTTATATRRRTGGSWRPSRAIRVAGRGYRKEQGGCLAINPEFLPVLVAHRAGERLGLHQRHQTGRDLGRSRRAGTSSQ